MKVLMALPMLVLAISGCTTSDGDFVTPDTDEEGRYIIKMTSSLRFVPEKAEIPLDDDGNVTIRFVHEGGGVHDVESEDGEWTKSPMIDSGSWDLVMDETGEFAYHCNPHEHNGMTGVLRIV